MDLRAEPMKFLQLLGHDIGIKQTDDSSGDVVFSMDRALDILVPMTARLIGRFHELRNYSAHRTGKVRPPKSPKEALDFRLALAIHHAMCAKGRVDERLRIQALANAICISSARLYFVEADIMDAIPLVPDGVPASVFTEPFPDKLRLFVTSAAFTNAGEGEDQGRFYGKMIGSIDGNLHTANVGSMDIDWYRYASGVTVVEPFGSLFAYLNAEPACVTRLNTSRPKRHKHGKARTETVSVVTVPRPRYESSPSTPTGEKRDFSCRFIVSAHWRMQRIGPGLAEVKPTLVREHVKGPEDKPLRPRVNRVRGPLQ